MPSSCSYSSKYLVFLIVFNLQNKEYYLKSNLMECKYLGLYNTMASIIWDQCKKLYHCIISEASETLSGRNFWFKMLCCFHYASINGLPSMWGGGGVGGQPTGIRLSEVHVGREFDILNIPRVGNLTQPPSCKVEDQGMSDERSAILENTQ